MATREPPSAFNPLASAREGREAFLDAILSEFEMHEMGVESGLRSYLLDDAIVDEAEWQEAVAQSRLDPEATQEVLFEFLNEAGTLARARSRYTVDLETGRQAFHEVVHVRFGKPYPFQC